MKTFYLILSLKNLDVSRKRAKESANFDSHITRRLASQRESLDLICSITSTKRAQLCLGRFWMSKYMSTLLHTCRVSADAGFVIRDANVNAIPTPPPQSLAIIGADGSWGALEWAVY
jgi:hypothetical protein